MKRLAFIITLLIGISSYAQLPVYGADSLMKHYASKAEDLLVDDSSLYDYFSIDLYGVSVFASPGDKMKNKPEYKVTWHELPVYKRLLREEPREVAMETLISKGGKMFGPAVQKKFTGKSPAKDQRFRPPFLPLAGLRVAIDPGHVANDTAMGRIEQKYIFMRVPLPHERPIYDTVAFAEGQLTWQTAALLAARLRNQGAEVMLTRSGPGITAYGKTFEQWLKDDYSRTLDSMLKADPKNQSLKDLKSGKMKEDRSKFRFVFKDAELRKRSEIINAFNPDLTVVIHYNVDEANAPWDKPTNKNYCMLFVPGAFQKDELAEPEDRFDFLRLLLLDDIENSTEASGIVARQFKEKLRVPLAGPSDAGYLLTSCKKTRRAGVFARNLSMTRLVQGTIIYGETLYQDNAKEAIELNTMSITDRQSGITTSKRVLQVAEAYFAGITEWYYNQ